MAWASSFSQLYLWIQPLLQSPPKILPLLPLTSLFYPYFFIKPSLQSLLSFPSAIPQQFSTSFFLGTTIPVIYTKNIFPISTIQPNQATSGDQGATESCEERHCFNLPLLSQSSDSENRTVCYYHVTYAFQRGPTLYSCLNVKERLARNRGSISSLSDSNGIRTHSHLVRIVKAAIECRLSLKRVRDMIITYSQVQRTDKHLQHSSIIWPVTLNG